MAPTFRTDYCTISVPAILPVFLTVAVTVTRTCLSAWRASLIGSVIAAFNKRSSPNSSSESDPAHSAELQRFRPSCDALCRPHKRRDCLLGSARTCVKRSTQDAVSAEVTGHSFLRKRGNRYSSIRRRARNRYSSRCRICSSFSLCFACLPVLGFSSTMRTGLGCPTRSRAFAFTAFVAENFAGFRLGIAMSSIQYACPHR